MTEYQSLLFPVAEYSKQKPTLIPLIQYKQAVSTDFRNYTIYKYELQMKENLANWERIDNNNRNGHEVTHVLVSKK